MVLGSPVIFHEKCKGNITCYECWKAKQSSWVGIIKVKVQNQSSIIFVVIVFIKFFDNIYLYKVNNRNARKMCEYVQS